MARLSGGPLRRGTENDSKIFFFFNTFIFLRSLIKDRFPYTHRGIIYHIRYCSEKYSLILYRTFARLKKKYIRQDFFFLGIDDLSN